VRNRRTSAHNSFPFAAISNPLKQYTIAHAVIFIPQTMNFLLNALPSLSHITRTLAAGTNSLVKSMNFTTHALNSIVQAQHFISHVTTSIAQAQINGSFAFAG